MRTLETTLYIEQIEDGTEYEGNISFGDNYKMKYILKCDQNIGKLDELAVNDLEAAIEQMHLSFRNSDNRKMEIPGESLRLVQTLILPFALAFYKNLLVKGANSSYIPNSKNYQCDVEVGIGMDQKVRVNKESVEKIFQDKHY